MYRLVHALVDCSVLSCFQLVIYLDLATYYLHLYRKSSRDGRGDSGGGSGEQENVKAVETLSNIERRLDGIVAAGNNSREGIDMNSMFCPITCM